MTPLQRKKHGRSIVSLTLMRLSRPLKRIPNFAGLPPSSPVQLSKLLHTAIVSRF